MHNVFGKTALALAIGLTAMVGGAFAAEPIKLGSIYSLTGSYAVIEDPALKGAKLAVKEINAAGGIKGRTIQLIQYDGKSTLADIANAAQRLVHEDQVIAIVGVADFGLLPGERAHRARCGHSLSRHRRHRAEPAGAGR